MNKLLNVYKPKGLTPLQVIKLVKERFPEYESEKIGFAGRLDPLAHGVLLLMVGETAKDRDKYLDLPKEYEFEAVFGISTDTYDTLGLLNNKLESQSTKSETASNAAIANSNDKKTNDKNVLKFENLGFDVVSNFDIRTSDLKNFTISKLGKQTQIYPPYSSKTVNGKPLFLWAKENRLSDIKIPEREIEIYDFKLLEMKKISAEKLKEEIMRQIDSVTGDFRQKEIKERWNEFFLTYCHFEEAKRREIPQKISQSLQDFEMTYFHTAHFKISCSSGTYVRSLVNELGNKLGTGAITLEILRTKVGKYSLNSSIKLS